MPRIAHSLFPGSALAVVLAIGFNAGVASAAIEDGLVSYWPLDDNIDDTVGANHGTMLGTDTVSRFDTGKFGGGIVLDGVDQRIDVGNDATLDMSLTGPAANGHVSISAWFRVDSFTKTWQALISKGEGSAFRIARRGDTNELGYAGGSGEAPEYGGNHNDGGLHHVAAVSENGVSTRMWVDGVLVATGGAPTINNEGNSAGSNPSLLIGENPQTANRSWHGLIDDVAIWNRVLTEQEIADIYNGGAGTSINILTGGTDFIKGDVNGDMVVDIADYEIIRNNFHKSPGTREEGNLDFNFEVGMSDFREWKTAFEAAPAAVPEPTALVLLGLGVALCGTCIRRRRA